MMMMPSIFGGNLFNDDWMDFSFPDIDITMYRQVFYHANKYMTKEMEKFVEYCRL